MRRTYISPEFKYDQVFGTLNMQEESSFFGSKMLQIQDIIEITNQNLIYYQNQFAEQLNLQKEFDFLPIVFDTNVAKKNNHKIVIDDSQSEYEKNNSTKWLLDIKIKDILREYLFATLKKYRTFEGIRNQMTYNRSVDLSIRDYIEKNTLNLYKFSNIQLYQAPVDLLLDGVFKNSSIWDPNLNQSKFLMNKFSTELNFDESNLKIRFSQNYSPQQFAIKYNFNLIFEKI